MLLWFTTMNHVATLAHISFVILLLFVGFKGQFENHIIRRFVLLLGVATLTFTFMTLFTSIVPLNIKPLDATLLSLAGISLALVGLYIPAELEYVPSKLFTVPQFNFKNAFTALNPSPLINSTAQNIQKASKPRKIRLSA